MQALIKETSSRALLLAILCASSAAVGCKQTPNATPAVAVASVEAAPVITRPIRVSDEFNGRIWATGYVDIRPRVTGYVDRIAFSEGKTGRFFTEFALTLAGAVVVSGFVALTLSATLASRILHHETKHNAMFNFGERVLQRIAELYRHALGAALDARPIVIALMLLVGSASVLFYRSLPSELAPMEDQGTVMVFAIAPGCGSGFQLSASLCPAYHLRK